jgi:hypothetical protein
MNLDSNRMKGNLNGNGQMSTGTAEGLLERENYYWEGAARYMTRRLFTSCHNCKCEVWK